MKFPQPRRGDICGWGKGTIIATDKQENVTYGEHSELGLHRTPEG
jgi:hypothetical protein